MKIDFKKHKKETREFLQNQYRKQVKKELIDNLIFAFIIILVFGILGLIVLSNNKSTIANCIKDGFSKDYCEATVHD